MAELVPQRHPIHGYSLRVGDTRESEQTIKRILNRADCTCLVSLFYAVAGFMMRYTHTQIGQEEEYCQVIISLHTKLCHMLHRCKITVKKDQNDKPLPLLPHERSKSLQFCLSCSTTLGWHILNEHKKYSLTNRLEVGTELMRIYVDSIKIVYECKKCYKQ